MSLTEGKACLTNRHSRHIACNRVQSRAIAQIAANRMATRVVEVKPEPFRTLTATAMLEPFKVHQGFPAPADALDTLQILMEPARHRREWLTLQEVEPTTPEWLKASSR